MDDEWLIERYRRGDLTAFERLFREHYASVYRVAARLSPCPDDAADAVQEAFLAAWHQRERFDGRASFRTWLIAVAVRKCADRARRATTVSLDGPAPPPVSTPPGSGPERLALSRERDAALHAAVLSLPRAQRDAVLLHYMDGLTCVEAAAAMGIAPGTVMTHLSRARATLRARLGWLDDEENLS